MLKESTLYEGNRALRRVGSTQIHRSSSWHTTSSLNYLTHLATQSIHWVHSRSTSVTSSSVFVISITENTHFFTVTSFRIIVILTSVTNSVLVQTKQFLGSLIHSPLTGNLPASHFIEGSQFPVLLLRIVPEGHVLSSHKPLNFG